MPTPFESGWLRRGFLSLAVLALVLAGCGSSSGGDPAEPPAPLSGAGGKLVAPLMAKWMADYKHRTGKEVTYRTIPADLNIRPVGRTADFGSQEAPITPDQFSEAKGTVGMVPWALSGVAVVYNVKGVPNGLRLNLNVLVDIFLHRITSWDDPAIAALNPGIDLPHTPITPVYRKDLSGETYVFTDYLALNSKRFALAMGVARNLDYPGGVGVEGKAAVADKIAKTNGSIGYLDLPDALAQNLDIAEIENAAGRFQKPTARTLRAGAKSGTVLGRNNEVWLGVLPASAKEAYPLVTFSYATVPVESKRAADLKRFLSYAISPAGQAFAAALHFAPLPPNVVAADKKAIAVIVQN